MAVGDVPIRTLPRISGRSGATEPIRRKVDSRVTDSRSLPSTRTAPAVECDESVDEPEQSRLAAPVGPVTAMSSPGAATQSRR